MLDKFGQSNLVKTLVGNYPLTVVINTSFNENSPRFDVETYNVIAPVNLVLEKGWLIENDYQTLKIVQQWEAGSLYRTYIAQ